MGNTQQLEYALTGLMEETLHFGTTGLCSIGKDGFTYLNRDKRLVLGTKESVDTGTRTEIDATGNKRHIVFVRH